MLTTFNEVDLSAIKALRAKHQESFTEVHGVKLGFMSFFVKAAVRALQQVPAINAMIDGEEIVENHYYDIGIAVSTEKGLIVPVVPATARHYRWPASKKRSATMRKRPVPEKSPSRISRRRIHHYQRRRFWLPSLNTHSQLTSKRNPWHAHHSGSTRCR